MRTVSSHLLDRPATHDHRLHRGMAERELQRRGPERHPVALADRADALRPLDQLVGRVGW